MNKEFRLLIIGGNKKILSKAKKLNINIISILNKSLANEELLEYAEQTFQVDNYENIEMLKPLLFDIYEKYPFYCAISFTEYGLIPAAAINELFDLPGSSFKTVTVLKNKYKMRRLLKEKEISSIEFAIGSSERDIENFLDLCKGTIIVKPIDGSGSFGIIKIENKESIGEKWTLISSLGLSSFLMEEYIPGPEISVETISFAGQHNIIAITDKLTQEQCVEIGHSVPSQISQELKLKVISIVKDFLNAVGLTDGPSHTEIKLSPKGPKIIESHNRIGGDSINELVEIAYAIDMVSTSLQWSLRNIQPLSAPIKNVKGSAIRFLTPSAGIVKDIIGFKEVTSSPNVVQVKLDVKIGDEIKPMRHSTDRVGYIITEGADVNSAIKHCDKLKEKLIIITEPI